MKRAQESLWKVLCEGLALVLAVVMLAVPSFAAVIAEDSDGNDLGFVERVKGARSVSGNTAIMANVAQPDQLSFTPAEFAISKDTNDGNKAYLVTGTTAPDLVSASSLLFIRWETGEDTPVEKTFRVPDNYISGGSFKVMLGRSGTGIPPTLNWEVLVNRSLTALDAAATAQTGVQPTNVGSGSPEEKTLTVTTDFASLAAGDIVTLRIWRGTTGSEDLKFFGGAFLYNTQD